MDNLTNASGSERIVCGSKRGARRGAPMSTGTRRANWLQSSRTRQQTTKPVAREAKQAPVEPASAMKNLGEFPTLTDQGEDKGRSRARKGREQSRSATCRRQDDVEEGGCAACHRGRCGAPGERKEDIRCQGQGSRRQAALAGALRARAALICRPAHTVIMLLWWGTGTGHAAGTDATRPSGFSSRTAFTPFR